MQVKIGFLHVFFLGAVRGPRFPPNFAAKFRQHRCKTGISAVDQSGICHPAFPLRCQRRDHQRRPAPQVRRGRVCPFQSGARQYTQRPSFRAHPPAEGRKPLGTGKAPFKHHILDAAFAVCRQHCRRQKRGCVGSKRRVNTGKHFSCPVQPPEPGNNHAFRPIFYAAAHLFQNFQQRSVDLRCTAGQFHPASRRRAGAGKGGCHDAVGHGCKAAPGKAAPPLHPNGAAARALHTGTAPVEKCRQINDLRFPGRAPQDGFPLCRCRCQQQRFGGSHAGKPQGDLRSVQTRGCREDQPLSLCAADRAHLRKPRKMQVHRPCADAAPARQHRLRTAQPYQQRRTEQNGRPHPGSGVCTQTADPGHTLYHDVAALPACFTPGALQQLQTGVHVRKLRHRPQPHGAAAQEGRRQQRQHAVFRRRDAHGPVQRPPARDDEISFHKNSPRSAKDTPCYAEWEPMVRICSKSSLLFVRSFV